MVNMLWEVAYGVFKEILCLAIHWRTSMPPEADLMDLKNDILASHRSPGTSTGPHPLGPHLPLLLQGSSEKKSTLGDTFTPSKAIAPVPICASILSSLSHGLGEMPSPLCEAPRPTARDPVSLNIYVLWAENLPHFELPYVGIDHGIQLQSYDEGNPCNCQSQVVTPSCHSHQGHSFPHPLT